MDAPSRRPCLVAVHLLVRRVATPSGVRHCSPEACGLAEGRVMCGKLMRLELVKLSDLLESELKKIMFIETALDLFINISLNVFIEHLV
jgi:hypothetical protein